MMPPPCEFRLSGVGALLLVASHCAYAPAEDAFRIVRQNDAWWFVAPDGSRFWSSGVNSAVPGEARESYDEKRPQYASWRYYRDDEEWAADSLQRLADWNFNTLGGWHDARLRQGATAYAEVLHLGSYAGVPWNDMFADDFAKQTNKVAQDLIDKQPPDANMIGWFLDNELAWYSEWLFDYHLGQPSTSKTRQRLVEMLETLYQGDFANVQRDFVADDGVADFDTLAERGRLKLRPGGEGSAVIEEFVELLADRYYAVTCEAVRRCDPNRLILGDRYHGYCPDAVVRAAGRHLDVISTNFDWPRGVDGYLPLCYLRRLHELTGKPVLITEYYATATENRSGNPNSGGLFVVTDTQAQRAAAAERRLAMFAAEPYIVGAHWFAFADEPPHGRADGEDYNFGLVDIHNVPYEEVTGALRRSHGEAISQHAQSRLPAIEPSDAAPPVSVPRLPTDFSLDQIDQCLLGQAHPQPRNKAGLADMSIAWSAEGLTVTLAGNHFVHEAMYAATPPPLSEGLAWTVTVVRDGQAHEAKMTMLGERAEVTPGKVDHRHWQRGVRFGATLALAGTENAASWRSGDEISLKSELRDSRLDTVATWDATLRLTDAPVGASLTSTRIPSSRYARVVATSSSSATEEAGQ